MLPTTTQAERVANLRQVLHDGKATIMPGCYDGLSSKLIERAGFDVAFMTGYGVSAVHGFPDTQLVSAAEMVQAATTVCSSLKSLPCIGDGDTGYGNAINVKRTVAAYASAGMAGIMLEDQVSPKRCGHTKGKAIVPRDEAAARIQAAVDARKEGNFDIVIMARTDARATDGLEEAIQRCIMFHELGADITFLEAPRSVEEMKEYCSRVPGIKTANMVEKGMTPVLWPQQLQEIGYGLIIYPVTLLNATLKTMEKSLHLLDQQSCDPNTKAADGNATPNEELNALLVDFEYLKDVVGFNDYYAEADKYGASKDRSE